jgi:pimeloyl-ACP methyl ester carboxylesterase
MPEVILGGHRFYYRTDEFCDPWVTPEVVIFHHGFARNHKLWYQWVPLLSDRYQCLRFDFRGHGASAP